MGCRPLHVLIDDVPAAQREEQRKDHAVAVHDRVLAPTLLLGEDPASGGGDKCQHHQERMPREPAPGRADVGREPGTGQRKTQRKPAQRHALLGHAEGSAGGVAVLRRSLQRLRVLLGVGRKNGDRGRCRRYGGSGGGGGGGGEGRANGCDGARVGRRKCKLRRAEGGSRCEVGVNFKSAQEEGRRGRSKLPHPACGGV